MARILANDGIHAAGKQLLEDAGHTVDTTKIKQELLAQKLPSYEVICVRSATKVRKELMDVCPGLKIIARGGVGLDNIDVAYAKSKNIKVINTPAASSRSVAELVFAHLFGLSRFLHLSNREMPSKGHTKLKELKKSYAKGMELGGRTLGIIGLGRIGQEVAKLAMGIGMRVVATDPAVDEIDLLLEFKDNDQTQLSLSIETVGMEALLSASDMITIHVPSMKSALIGAKEIDKMRDGVIIINASRGGLIDEDALLAALNSGKVARAALDVFVGEPSPREDLLNHPNISLSPHIGASTEEAQANIGIELAEKIIAVLG